MENNIIDKLWEDFRIENPNTVGGFQEQYVSFKWLYDRLKVTEDTSEHHKSDNVHKNFNNTKKMTMEQQKIKIEDIINKYPKIFEQYEGNPNMVNWYGVPEGWLHIIDELCGCIQNYIDSTRFFIDGETRRPEQVTCIQMKEKYGGLRFYVNNADDYVYGMIRMAEHLCYNTCDECGSRSDLGVTSGWISVKCRNCIIAHGDRAMASWEPKK